MSVTFSPSLKAIESLLLMIAGKDDHVPCLHPNIKLCAQSLCRQNTKRNPSAQPCSQQHFIGALDQHICMHSPPPQAAAPSQTRRHPAPHSTPGWCTRNASKPTQFVSRCPSRIVLGPSSTHAGSGCVYSSLLPAISIHSSLSTSVYIHTCGCTQ